MDLHPAYLRTEIAFRYYQKRWPERNYTKEHARKQFAQDRNIDKGLLKQVIKEVTKEALSAL